MVEKPQQCESCSLWGNGKGFIRPEGTGSLGVLILGEAGGESEEREALPFRPYAQAGSLLERVIRACGYNRQQFRIANIVNCRPPNNWLVGAPHELDAINHCAVHRDALVQAAQPKCILALGDTALRVLTGHAGTKRSISYLRGYVLPTMDWDAIPVVSSYHPAFIRRGKTNLIGVLANDIKRAVEVAHAHNEDWLWQPEATDFPLYQLQPSRDDAERFLSTVLLSPESPLAFDIETPHSALVNEDEVEDDEAVAAETEIISIQFSNAVGQAIFLPWTGDYIDIARRLLASPNPKVGHNSLRFDAPRLARQGVAIAGDHHDTMLMWRHLQPDLPANLQFVASFAHFPFPWKHLADSDAAFYGCCDADATLRSWHHCKQELERQGLWSGYYDQKVRLDPILVRMSARGMPVDDAVRQEFGARLLAESTTKRTEIIALVPDAVRPRKLYKRPPIVVKEGELVQPEGEGWVKLLPFNPASWQQLVAYMKHRGHKVPLTKAGKETTGGEELQRLARDTRDPIYTLVDDLRELEKMLSTYVEGWAPATDGCVHGQFYHETGTGQLNSKRPNMQNAPKKSALAKDFRRLVRAQEGHKLIEFDYTAFHALTLGFEAGDASYMRLARLDIHSFVAAHLLRLEGHTRLAGMADEELREALARIKADHKTVRDTKAKPAILGIGFGMGERKLYDMNRDSFATQKEARDLKALLKDLFPRIFAWQDEIRMRAHRAAMLKSRFGYVRWFFDVYHTDPRSGKLVAGEDSEAAIAFLPSNDAFGHIKQVMLTLSDNGWDSRYGLCGYIHDSLLFHCPTALADECIATLHATMTAPSPILIDPKVAPLGLTVGIEAAMGDDWNSMSKVPLSQYVAPPSHPK